jgi:hypothetical protein
MRIRDPGWRQFGSGIGDPGWKNVESGIWIRNTDNNSFYFLGEAEICVTVPAFYGLLSYALGLTVVLSLAGIRVGRRIFRRRSGHASQETGPPPEQQLALEGGQLLDLVPERRAPPIRDPESVPFQEIMMSVLGSRQNRVNNPFY